MLLNACTLKIIFVQIYCCGFGAVVNFLLTALFKLVNGLTPESSWSWLPSSSIISSSFSSSEMSTKDTASSKLKLTRNVFVVHDLLFRMKKTKYVNKINIINGDQSSLTLTCNIQSWANIISFDPESLSQNFQTTRGRFRKNSVDLKTETGKLVSTRMKL